MCVLVGFENSAILLVTPKQSCSFIVRFAPHEKKEEFCKINLFTMNNPYEDQFVKICGFGYSHDVFLKGLPTFYVEKNESLYKNESETNETELVRRSDLLTRNGSQNTSEAMNNKRTMLKNKFQNAVDTPVKSRLKQSGKKTLQNGEIDNESVSVTSKSKDNDEQILLSNR